MMFEHLPKLTEEDIEYSRDILLPQLLELPTGTEKNLDEILIVLAPELMRSNFFLAEAAARGTNAVASLFEEQLPQDVLNSLKIGMCVTQVLLLILVNRKLGEVELSRRLKMGLDK